MGIECGAIVMIFLLMTGVYFIRGHKEWAFVMLPLILLPLADVVLELVLVRALKVKVTAFAAVITLVAAVAVSAVWIGLASFALREKHKRSSVTFIVIANVFNVALATIIISDILRSVQGVEAFIEATSGISTV